VPTLVTDLKEKFSDWFQGDTTIVRTEFLCRMMVEYTAESLATCDLFKK
jgi:hypothetical protein